MIAVDTSALMSIVLNEPEAGACIAAIEARNQKPETRNQRQVRLLRHPLGGQRVSRSYPPSG
jgi:uncharacterized protein with PIN domain